MNDADQSKAETVRPLLLFDGDCGFCSGWVRFVLWSESESEIVFSPLESSLAQGVLGVLSKEASSLDTVVFVDREGRIFQQFDAILVILDYLHPAWQALRAFLLIPRSVRNFGYAGAARIRKYIPMPARVCQIPSAQLLERHIND